MARHTPVWGGAVTSIEARQVRIALRMQHGEPEKAFEDTMRSAHVYPPVLFVGENVKGISSQLAGMAGSNAVHCLATLREIGLHCGVLWMDPHNHIPFLSRLRLYFPGVHAAMYQHQYNRQLPTDWFHQVESLPKLMRTMTFDFELRDFILPSDHRLVEAELERVRKARRGEPSAARRLNLSDNAAQAVLAAGGRVEHDWVCIHEAWWRRFGETFYRNPDENPFAREYLQSSWWHCLPNREKGVIPVSYTHLTLPTKA